MPPDEKDPQPPDQDSPADPTPADDAENTVTPNSSEEQKRKELDAWRLAEIRRKLETGEYNSQRVAEEVARKIIRRGDV